MSDTDFSNLKGQFLTEGRDLVEAAGECLLRLEKSPDDSAMVAALFRAVHTLKGNSGLFPVAPLTRVVHAAEDLLDEVRAGNQTLDPDMTDVLLDTFDQVSEWLEAFDQDDVLPAEADQAATDLAARLAVFRFAAEAEAPPVAEPEVQADWLDDLPPAERDAADAILREVGPAVLIDYRPDDGCFFRGEDPLLFMLNLPGRVWLSIGTTVPLTPSAQFDPFHCVLRFRAISTASLDDVRSHLAYVAAQVTLGTATGSPTAGSLDPVLQGLLTQTAEALAQRGPADGLPGRLASTGTLLTTLLGPTGLATEAEIEAAHQAALAAGDAQPLISLLAIVQARASAPAATVPAPVMASPPATEDIAANARAPAPRRQGVLKVDQARIDVLMKLAGELIVAKNGLPFLARRAEEDFGSRLLAREIRSQFDIFNRIVEELQTAVMQVRMVPLGTVFERFRRLVRDLSRQVEKPLAFVVEGEETEADKNIVEDLAEPLIHLIRNAVDHGLEPPDERAALGKPVEGQVRLAARLAEDKVVIEVADDGRGIDVARVRAKAIERGLLSAEEAAQMPDDDAMRLILRPGFSTAEAISALSGRGVGMDVVATMVERSGGTLSLRSQPGQGTTVAITLPLSMTVRRMMMVDLAGSAYGVPLEMVLETVRVPRAALHQHLGPPQIVRRGRLIPLCDLRRALRLGPAATTPAELSVLVVTTPQGEVGLIVDAFRSGVEVIPQPLDGPLAGLSCFSGAALLGDGSILMLLDIEEVLKCPW